MRLNALTYGLRTRGLILPWEDPRNTSSSGPRSLPSGNPKPKPNGCASNRWPSPNGARPHGQERGKNLRAQIAIRRRVAPAGPGFRAAHAPGAFLHHRGARTDSRKRSARPSPSAPPRLSQPGSPPEAPRHPRFPLALCPLVFDNRTHDTHRYATTVSPLAARIPNPDPRPGAPSAPTPHRPLPDARNAQTAPPKK